MKLISLKNVLIVSMIIFLASGCGQSTKVRDKKGTTPEGKEAIVEVGSFDATQIKDEIVDVINNSPKPEEIADFLNNAGASYILDLTVPVTDVDKFTSETQMGLGLGMYSFDLFYAKVFNRSDMVLKISELEQQLLDKLGLENEFTYSEKYRKRLQDNAENEDSVDALVNEMLNLAHKQFSTSNKPGTYALSFVGANIEALYILTQVTSFARNKKPLIDFIGQQDERANNVFTLLEMMSGDNTVKPYFNKMKLIKTYYELHPEFTEKELKEISPMIEDLRNNIFK